MGSWVIFSTNQSAASIPNLSSGIKIQVVAHMNKMWFRYFCCFVCFKMLTHIQVPFCKFYKHPNLYVIYYILYEKKI
jgi:hypothetical protein